MMDDKYKIGWCPICNQGWVQIVKHIADGNMLIMCSECENSWNSPELFFNHGPTLEWNSIGRVLVPTVEEVMEKGWDRFIHQL